MSKLIYGNKNSAFIVDDEDYEWLKKYTWTVRFSGYAQTYVKEMGKACSMHRMVMGDPEGLLVDHINRMPNDNRKSNLRTANNSQNISNSKKSENTSSEYKGVTKRGENSYEVTITKDKMTTYVGTFRSEQSAANAYNYHATEKFGEFANLNEVEYEEKEIWSKNKSKTLISSDYLGVHKYKDNYWRVRFNMFGKNCIFGYYTDEKAAANAYNHYIKEFRTGLVILNDVEYMSLEETDKKLMPSNRGCNKYKGISITKNGKWQARIKHNSNEVKLGTYQSEELAAIAYNSYILKNNIDKPLNIVKDLVDDTVIELIAYSQDGRLGAIQKFLDMRGIPYITSQTKDSNFDTSVRVKNTKHEVDIYSFSGFCPLKLLKVVSMAKELYPLKL